MLASDMGGDYTGTASLNRKAFQPKPLTLSWVLKAGADFVYIHIYYIQWQYISHTNTII